MQDGHLGLDIRSNIKWNPIIKRNQQVLALTHQLPFKKKHANTEIEPTKDLVMKQLYCSGRGIQKKSFDNSSTLNEKCYFKYDLIPLCKSSNQPPYVYYFFLH
jgi:hypothetical protein